MGIRARRNSLDNTERLVANFAMKHGDTYLKPEDAKQAGRIINKKVREEILGSTPDYEAGE